MRGGGRNRLKMNCWKVAFRAKLINLSGENEMKIGKEIFEGDD